MNNSYSHGNRSYSMFPLNAAYADTLTLYSYGPMQRAIDIIHL